MKDYLWEKHLCKKRLFSWLMAMVMVLSIVGISTPFKVKAVEQSISTSTVDIGVPTIFDAEDGVTTFTFNDTLKIDGIDIVSVSIQFVSPAQEGIEGIDYDGLGDAKFVRSDLSNDIHLMINSADGNPIAADDWKQLLIEHVKIKVKKENTRKVMVSVSDKENFGSINLIEYNADNGHYYELVPKERGGDVNWNVARENALKASSMGPNYEGYLVNVTSSAENRFLYSICRTTSWIGTSCDPQIKLNGKYDSSTGIITYDDTIYSTYGSADAGNIGYPYGTVTDNKAYWFYVDGPEAGMLMTYGAAQTKSYNAEKSNENTMKLANKGISYDIGTSGKTAIGAYEDNINNWANNDLWKSSILYESWIDPDVTNEPNKNGDEYYMVIYARDDYGSNNDGSISIKNGWLIPSMWNDFANSEGTVTSYVIEYSLKDDTTPDVTVDNRQSTVTLDGNSGALAEPTVLGNNFMITVSDAHKKNGKNIDSDYINSKVKELSKASATTDGLNPTDVKNLTNEELENLKNAVAGDSVPITLVNESNEEITKDIVATLYDNVTGPVTDSSGNVSQIGSNNFSVRVGTSITAKNVWENGNVTVVTNGIVDDENINYTIPEGTDTEMQNLLDALNDTTAEAIKKFYIPVTDTVTGLTTTVTVSVVPVDKVALESAKLKPFKDDATHEHYLAGDTVTVEEISLNDGTVIKDPVVMNDNFTFKWQWNVDGNDKSKWNDIVDYENNTATGIVLSSEMTEKYAKNKIQVVIIPKTGTEYNTDQVKGLYVDGDASAKITDINDVSQNTGGTFIDILTIDASDFIVTLTDAKVLNDTDNSAEEAAGVLTELDSNNSNPASNVEWSELDSIDSDVETTLNTVDKTGTVDVTYTATLKGESGNSTEARNKNDTSVVGKTVKAHVVDNMDSNIGSDGKTIAAIGANDITVNTKVAATFVMANSNDEHASILLNKAGVVVVKDGNTVTNPLVTITYDTTKPLEASEGDYYVTYSYSNGTTDVTTKAKVTVVDENTKFEVTPTNPDPKNPEDMDEGITGPVKDTIQSSGDNYVFTIHLDSDVDSVLLTPIINNATVTGFTVTNDMTADLSSLDTDNKYTVKNVTTDEKVTVKYTVTNLYDNTVSTYTYIIDRAKKQNVDIDTITTDPTPDDPSDDPKITEDGETKQEDVNGDGVVENVKDIRIAVPYKVTSIEIIPKTEDPNASFITGYGDNGLKVSDGTVVDTKNITSSSAKFTLKDLKVDETAVASVKVKSADGTETCIYRYTVSREKNNDATIKDATPTHGSTDTEKVIEVTISGTSYTWPIELNDPKAAVTKIEKDSGDGTLVIPDDKKSFTVNDLGINNTTTVKITTVAENGVDTLTYVVKITRDSGAVEGKGIPEIQQVDVRDTDGNDQPADVKIKTSDNTDENSTVDITVPSNQPNYTFRVQTGPLSKITELTKLDGPAEVEGTDDGFKATGLDDKTPTRVKVTVTEVSGDTRTYIVTINRARENVTPTVTDDMNGGTIKLSDYLPESVRNNAKEIIYHCCAHTVLAIDKDGTARAMRRNPNSMNNSLVHIIVKGYDNKYTDYTVFFHVTAVTKEEEYGTLVNYKGINYELTGDNTCRVSSWKTNAAIKKKNVVIPASIKSGKKTYKVTEIAPAAFLNNSKIQTLTIGKNVKTIGNTSFVGMSKLNKFVVAKGNKYFRTAGKSGNSAKMLLTKNKKTLIAMSNVKGKVTLPKTVTRVTEYAGAANYKMKELVIPKNVKRIDPCAFAHATKMKKVTFKGKLPEMSNNCILDRMNYKKGTVTVPKKYYNNYKKAFQSASKKRYGLKQFPDISHLKKSK